MGSEIKDCPNTLFLTERPAPTTRGWFWAKPHNRPNQPEYLMQPVWVHVTEHQDPNVASCPVVRHPTTGALVYAVGFRWFGPLPVVMEASGGC